MNAFTIGSTVKKYPKKISYETIKNKILGAKYNLSLVFIGKQKAFSLNKSSRNKDYIPNVLSFPLSEKYGEIYICPEVAKKEAENFNLTTNGHIAFLFIHGLLHLKGYNHGKEMSKMEKRYLKAFSIK